MSARKYTSPATITIGGVRVPVEGLTFEMARADDPHDEAIIANRAGFVAMPQRVEFTIADSGDAFAAITRMIDAANREVSRAILGGAVPSEGGRWYAWGSRGCFHEGCDGTGSVEHGGSHWCRWAT